MGVPELGDVGGSPPVISARGLGRRFGDRRALVGVDLDVGAGSFLLVTGPNGSGKSTLLRVLAGLLAPTEGTLEVDIDRQRLGFLGHEPLLYRELTVLENLDLYGRLYRVPERRERVGMLLERYGLWAARREQTSTLSRGMIQRLALCRTFLHDPDVLLLDEPFSALDREGAELLEAELGGHGSKTLVVASHQPERLAAHATETLVLA